MDPATLAIEARWLRRLVGQLALPEADADDVAQTTWLRALSAPRAGIRNVRGWLAAIAGNVRRDVITRRPKQVRWEQAAARSEVEPVGADAVARAELHRQVVEAVLALAEPYRTTVLWRFFEDLSTTEIARRHGVAEETVRTRLHRALKRLRETLDGRYGHRSTWLVVAASGAGEVTRAAVATGGVLMSAKPMLGVASIVFLAVGWLVFREPLASGGARVGRPAAIAERPLADAAPRPHATPARAADSHVTTPAPLVVSSFRPDVKRTITVTGRIVDARTLVPVRDAHVQLEFEDASVRVPDGVTTDDGRFTMAFTGESTLVAHVVTHADYAPAVADARAAFDAAAARPGAIRCDLGTISLMRGTAVRGRVLHSKDDTPVAGARLAVANADLIAQPFRWCGLRPCGDSDGDGWFTLTERIAPFASGMPTLFAITPEGAGWAKLAVVDGLETLDGIVVHVAESAVVHVPVVDTDGNPIAGATVTAVPRFNPLGKPDDGGPDPSVGLFARDERFVARTDARGIATLRGLAITAGDSASTSPFGTERTYDFIASAPGHTRITMRAWPSPGETTLASIALSATVPWEIAGSVRGGDGAGIGGAQVRLVGSDSAPTTTDADGRFRLGGLDTSVSRAQVDVSATGFGSRLCVVWRPAEGGVANLDVVLHRRRPIEGRVVDEAGGPMRGVRVAIAAEPATRGAEADSTATTTDDAGHFVFSDATVARWTLTVHAPEGFQPMRPRRIGEGEREVLVRLFAHRRGRARVTIDVVDEATNAAGLPTTASLVEDCPRFRGDAPSTLECRRSVGQVSAECVPVGNWQARVEFQDGRSAAMAFAVGESDDHVRLRMIVGANARIRGRLDWSAVAEGLRRPTSLTVDPPYAATDGGGAHGLVSIGAGTSDSFVLADVTPGDVVSLRLADPEFCGSAQVSAKAAETADVVIPVHPATLLVFDSPKRDVGVTISLRDSRGIWRKAASELAGADGGLYLRVPPGKTHWRAEIFDLFIPADRRRPIATQVGDVELSAGDERRISLDVE